MSAALASRTNTAEIVADIEHNRLDLGFVTLPLSGRMLQMAPVLDDELVAIASRDGAVLAAKVTAAALARLPVITSEVGSNSRLVTDQWFARAGVAFRPATALANTQAIGELVRAGLGCAILPSLALRGRTRGLIERSLSPRLYRRLGIVVRRDKVLQRPLKEAIRTLSELGSVSNER